MKSESSSVSRYTRVAIALHWIIALLIAINIALIWSVSLLPDNAVRPVIDTHKSTGITVLGLVILRLLWRRANHPPALPADYALWEKRLAHAVHVTLYILMLALPLSGWMHDSAWKSAAQFPMQLFYLVPWPRIGLISNIDPQTKETLHGLFGSIHVWLSYLLYAMFFIHIAGALKHQWIDKDAELQRMLPRRRKRGGAKPRRKAASAS